MKKTQNNLRILDYIKTAWSDKKFFTSRQFKERVGKLCEMVTNRYKNNPRYVPIRTDLYWNPVDNMVACTNNNIIRINMDNNLIQKFDKNRRVLAIWGFLAHELGHCLYTDFTINKKFLAGDWDYSKLSAFDFYNTHKMAFIMYVKEMQNILEDPFIEYKITSVYTGSFKRGINLTTSLLQNSLKKSFNKDKYDIFTLLLAQARNCLPEEMLDKYPCLIETQKVFDRLYTLPEPTMTDRCNMTLELFDCVYDTFIKNDKNLSDEEIKKMIEQMKQNNQSSNTDNNENQNSSGMGFPLPMPSDNDSGNGSEKSSEQSNQKSSSKSSDSSSTDKKEEKTATEKNSNDSKDNKSDALDDEETSLTEKASEDDQSENSENDSESDNSGENDTENNAADDNTASKSNDDVIDETDDVSNLDDNTDKNDEDYDENNDSSNSDGDSDKTDQSSDEADVDSDDGAENEEDGNTSGSDDTDSDEKNKTSNSSGNLDEEDNNSETDTSDENFSEDNDTSDAKNTDNKNSENESSDKTQSSEENSTISDSSSEDNSSNESDFSNKELERNDELKNSESEITKNIDDSEYDNSLDFNPEDVISSVAKTLMREENSKITRDFNDYEIKNEITSTDFHRGVNYSITKIKNGSKVTYDYLVSNGGLKAISKQAQNKVRDAVLQKKRSLTQKKQSIGSRLDINAYARRKKDEDFNIFINSKKPSKDPLMAVSVIVDGSGSMKGTKMQYAKLASIILEDFCRNLNIPFSLISHDANYGYVKIREFVNFDSPKNERYNLTKLTDGNCNRDGFPIRYAMNKIKYRKEPFKLIIVISDGIPNDTNYGFTQALADITDIRKECRKKNIELIAFAIDSNIEKLKELYGAENLVDCRNLSKFPKNISRILAEKSAKIYK